MEVSGLTTRSEATQAASPLDRRVMPHTLLHGDCLEVMRGMEAASVDAIVTDPPYFRVKGEDWDNQWDDANHFIEWVGQLCEQFQRILKPSGSLYFFASPQMAARVECEIGKRFNVLSSIVWRKGSKGRDVIGWAQKAEKEALRSWVAVTERVIFAEQRGDQYGDASKALHKEVYAPLGRYIQLERERAGLTRNDVEVALGFVSSGDPTRGTALCYRWEEGSSLPTKETYNALREVLNRAGGEYLRREYEELRREYEELRRPFNVTAKDQWGDVWDFEPVMAYAGKHPCEKPQALLRHILYASTKPDALVFDPFMGGGSLGHACHETGRRFIGVEKCPRNFEMARQRVESASAQLVMYGV